MAETPTLDEFEATVVSLQENQRRFTSARVGENGAAIAKYGVGRARDIKAILKAGTAMIEHIAKLEALLSRLQWCGEAWSYGLSICPVCDKREDIGLHSKDCTLAALLPKEATDE